MTPTNESGGATPSLSRAHEAATLLAADGPFTVWDVAAQLDADRSNVSKWLRRLERDGLVRRTGAVRRRTGGGSGPHPQLWELAPEDTHP